MRDNIIVASDWHGELCRTAPVRQDRPAIVWWLFNHWCVFCGLNDQGRVVICNPDRGRYSMSVGMFKSYYSGVSLWNGEPHDLPGEVS